MKKCILFVLTVFILIACNKKEDNRSFSEWYVNSEKFLTNKVTAFVGRSFSNLETEDKSNGFIILFHTGYLPETGNYRIESNTLPAPGIAVVYFYKNGIQYVPPQYPSRFLHASYMEGKHQYQLDSAWFINKNNNLDSVLIYGNFSEP